MSHEPCCATCLVGMDATVEDPVPSVLMSLLMGVSTRKVTGMMNFSSMCIFRDLYIYFLHLFSKRLSTRFIHTAPIVHLYLFIYLYMYVYIHTIYSCIQYHFYQHKHAQIQSFAQRCDFEVPQLAASCHRSQGADQPATAIGEPSWKTLLSDDYMGITIIQ